MERSLAKQIKEAQDLSNLAVAKRKKLEGELLRLTRERISYLDSAERLKKQIQEIKAGLNHLPSIETANLDLTAAVSAALHVPGGRTLREICLMTGLKNTAVSQCLRGLIKKGQIRRTLVEGRERGASYELFSNSQPPTVVSKDTKTADPINRDRSRFFVDKFVQPENESDVHLETSSHQQVEESR